MLVGACGTRASLHIVAHPSDAASTPRVFAQSLAHPLPAHRTVLLEPTTPHLEVIDPVGCLKDANVNQNMCGPTARATCTGSHSPGVCCGSTGWCGSTDDHCGDGMLTDYSHSRGLCDSAVIEIAQQDEEENFDAKTSKYVSMQQIANATRSAKKWPRKCSFLLPSGGLAVAAGHRPVPPCAPLHPGLSGQGCGAVNLIYRLQAWVVATQGRSESDAQTLCVPAIVVAAGFTYDVGECPRKFALTVETSGESGVLKGLWQVMDPTCMTYAGRCVEGCD